MQPTIGGQEIQTVDDTGSWWSRPGGAAEVLKIALPLIISTGFFSLTLFVDRTLLYWYSDASASAAMSAGSVYWTIACLPVGLVGYVSIFVAQYSGAGQMQRVGLCIWQAIWLSVASIPIFLATIAAVPYLFAWSDHSAEMQDLEIKYYWYLAIGGIGAALGAALQGFFLGMGRTLIVMYVDFLTTIINLALDYVLIFGKLGFPEMGIEGAGLATCVSMWVKVPLLAWCMRRAASDKSFDFLAARRIDWPLMRRLVVYGWPSGVQQLSESAAFSIIMLNVGSLGEKSMAATTLALGVNILAFIPMMGLGIGISVLVGQRITQKKIPLAQRTVCTGLQLSVIYTSFFAILYGFFPDPVLEIYAMGVDPARFAEIRPLLKPLLAFIAIYCVLDGLQIVMVAAIKGAGDTWFVLLASVLLGFGVAVVGNVGGIWFGKDLFWWWFVITLWVLAMAIVFGWRYKQGKWKTMQVIEPPVPQVNTLPAPV